MKARKSLLFSVLAVATFAGAAHGSVFSTQFLTSEGYTLGDLNGQNGWLSNSATIPPDSYPGAIVALANGPVFGTRAGRIGWAAPLNQDNVYVYHGTDTPLIGGGVDAAFSSTFMVQNSDSEYGPGAENRDTFGFRLEGDSNSNLFSFFLTPTTHPAQPELESPAYYELSWSTGVGAPTVVLYPLKALASSNYTFSVDFFYAGDGEVGFTAGVGTYSGTPQTFSGTLGAGTSGLSIKNLGATWDTYVDKDNPGSNLMVFDNVSLVPEPSSALLGLLGASFLFVRRRRA